MPESATELLEHPAGEATEMPAEIADDGTDEIIADDQLVEEISIDGMCGVY